MPKSTLLPTAVAAALLLLGSACASDSDDAGRAAAKETDRPSSSAEPERDDAAKDGETDGADDKGEQANKRAAAAKERASRDKKADEAREAEAAQPDESSEEDSADDRAGDASEDPASKSGPTGTLTVAGGPFSSLSFPTVQCSGDSADLYLQSRSEDPAVVLTVLFSGGSAAHASLQTDPESGEGTIWSDDDAESMSASVQREDDTITLTDAVLKPFGDDSELTVSGSLTCNKDL